MIKIPSLKKIFVILALVTIGYTLMAPPTLAAPDCTKDQKTLCILGKNIGCDPAAPPGGKSPTTGLPGCGIPHFITLVQVVIGFLQIIIIPLAGGFIAYGGFVILTAGGSEERVKQGKKIITAAVIGIVISLGAYIIITALNFIIPAETGFQFQ